MDIFDEYKARNKHLACPIKFITFNYDLSLEFYIDQIVKRASKYSQQEKESFLHWIGNSIEHVYGQIGFYSWQKCSNPNSIDSWQHFTSDLLANNYTAGALNENENDQKRVLWSLARKFGSDIELISSIRTEKCKSGADIESWLLNTKTLIFTGYAFHPENNKVLGLVNNKNAPTKLGRNIQGVVLGLYKATRREKTAAKQLFSDALIGAAVESQKRMVMDGNDHPNLSVTKPWMIEYDLTTYDMLRNELVLSHLYSR